MGKSNHVLVVPFPVQGHINPMLQFAKRLASYGQMITLVTPTSMLTKSMAKASSITIHPIYDGFPEGENMENFDVYLKRFKVVFGKSLADLIIAQRELGRAPRVVVYDSVMPWILEIAHDQGLYAAPFFTQTCSVSSIYYHVQRGALKLPFRSRCLVSVPGAPLLLRINDLPSFISDPTSYPWFHDFLLSQFSNLHKADWLFFNSFDMLEPQTVRWMQSQWPIKTVGPTVPSIYLDRRFEDDTDYGLSLFKPNADVCLEWLNNKENGSVIYVAFGSLASLGQEQIQELALGLKSSQRHFLWVVRDTEETKLPPNFVTESSQIGLVVSWCSQLQVLSHKATGCFVTHCGWNSTMEALCLGVPMVAMPIWTDQTTNAKYIEDVWNVGVRVKPNRTGLVTREEIGVCVNQVITRNEFRINATKWKQVAKEAVDECGTSDNNIQDFLSKLASHDC